jgi:hypothetical protein
MVGESGANDDDKLADKNIQIHWLSLKVRMLVTKMGKKQSALPPGIPLSFNDY